MAKRARSLVAAARWPSHRVPARKGATTTLDQVMDLRDFFRQSRVLIVAGKGGVGKTTVMAALAHLASSAGLSALVVELEGREGLSTAFGHDGPLDYAESVLRAAGATPDEGDGDAVVPAGAVRARTITPDDALLEYLADHGLGRVSKRLMASGIVDLVAGAIPGIRDILVLGKVKQIERNRVADVVLVDAPATGHTLTFLSSASGLLDAARGGPIRSQAADVVDLLSDPARCQVVLVTLPEEMPVNEVVDAAFALEDRVGVALGPIIVNGCYPPLSDGATAAAEAASEAGVELSGAVVPRPRRRPPVPPGPPAIAGRAAGPTGPGAPARPAPDPPPLRAGHRPGRDRRALRRVGRGDRGTPRPGRGGLMSMSDDATSSDTTPADTTTMDAVVDERSIIICCGSGGVGKTTTAAALAVEAASRGRDACVVTIDPARRLANALGLDALTNRPSPIEGDWPGRLHALMLDPKATFDDLVTRYADSEEQAERIRHNRIYRNLTSSLSGTQEYMAAEKLYELTEEGDFDVVVVDTPPTRNALDFLDAPGRLTRFLENRVFQVLMKPTRAGLRFMGVAAHALLRTISQVAGADIVSDAVAFFQAFEGMEEGFRLRAGRVRELLGQPSTAFVLVASPRADSVEEAVHFADKLRETGMSVSALVVNRVQPRFADDCPARQFAAEVGRLGPCARRAHRQSAPATRQRRTAKSKPTPTWWPRWPRRPSTRCRCSQATCTTCPA